jgi:hypothetical protein
MNNSGKGENVLYLLVKNVHVHIMNRNFQLSTMLKGHRNDCLELQCPGKMDPL